MIYSKISKRYHIDFKIKSLDKCKFEDDDIFYYHAYHCVQENLTLSNFIDDVHWDHLRTNSNVKILYENVAETIGFIFIYELIEVIKNKNINPKQIYMLLMDDVHRDFAIKELEENGIMGVNINIYNYLLEKVSFPTNTDIPTVKKFSSLSRNYKDWRLRLYINLLTANLLKDFQYSFYNIHPYEQKTINHEQIEFDLTSNNIEINKTIKKWIRGVPYKLEVNDNVYNKWSDVTYQTILTSDIHLIVETIYHRKNFDLNENKPHSHFGPNFISEKTYKAIACKKPFLMFSSPFMLDDIRGLGFETFRPFIDETYDTIIDDDERLIVLVNEIKRINELPYGVYRILNEQLTEITNRNFEKLKQINERNNQKENLFDFLQKHVS